jgi:hypothetical protein
MIKLQKDDRPTYVLSYPRWVRLGRSGLVVLLMGAAVIRWALAWVHFVLPIVQNAGSSIPILQLVAAQPLRPLIAAHLGLPLAGGAVAIVFAFLPDLGLADEGLAVHTLRGWWLIPWKTIKTVRIASLEKPRRLVLVQGGWTRWSPWPRLVSLCLGAGFTPGLLLLSALRDFGPLMGRLYHEVKQAVPEAIFDAEFYPVPALLTVGPVSTLSDLADQARDEGWPLDISAQAMAAVPAGSVLVQGLILILAGGVWWKPLAIVGLGALEWAIGALYLYALAEIFPARVEFRQAVLLYPLPQVPRALLSVPMAMFIAAGLPFLAMIAGLAGVLWAVTLTALLVQQMFRLKSVLPAMAGGVLQALFLFLVLALVLTS